jgi:hypothetical protein
MLRRLIDGYQVSQAIHVAATLGIADLEHMRASGTAAPHHSELPGGKPSGRPAGR